MMCPDDNDGETTQEIGQRAGRTGTPSPPQVTDLGPVGLAVEAALDVTRKKERIKMLEELKRTEQDRIDVLWTELEGKRQKLDDAQSIVDELTQQIAKETAGIARLEEKLLDSGEEIQGNMREVMQVIRAHNTAEECSSPLDEAVDAKDDLEVGKAGKELVAMEPAGEVVHEKVAVQHVFDGVKKGRGRPRKYPIVEKPAAVGPKRGRGRPRKYPIAEPGAIIEVNPAASPKKRGRGRPPKNPEGNVNPPGDEVPPAPKRQRGRPRKVELE